MVDINKDQIKLMQSQTLDDTDEGGGQMTVNEVVDGNVNNLFPDISRLDRAYGRVSLRKAYLSVQTDDRAVYYGSHIALMEQAEDPLVSVTLFNSDDWFDYREDAINRMESYLAVGPQFPAAMYGNHYQGSRLITLFMNADIDAPVVGDVLAIKDPESGDDEYVRVTDIESETRTFSAANGQYTKRVATMEISNPLLNDYDGDEVTETFGYTKATTKINTTVAADASKYYGVSKLAADISEGDMQLQVANVMQSVVPSAQTNTALTDFGVGTSTAFIVGIAGGSVVKSQYFSVGPGATLTLGEAFVPGSFSLFGFTDDGNGNLIQSNTVVGSVDYETGYIYFGDNAGSGGGTTDLKYDRALKASQFAYTGETEISQENRSFTYVYNFYPNPYPGSVKVDFLAGGKWYSLTDDGKGVVSGSSPDLGSGSINYLTGTLSLSLGYMPDVGSSILFYWAQDFSYVDLQSENVPLSYDFDLEEAIACSTLAIGFSVGSTDFILEDDGFGKITYSGNNIGTVNYSRAKISFEPPCTPFPGTIFNVAYSAAGDKISESSSESAGTLVNSNPIANTISASFDIAGTYNYFYDQLEAESPNTALSGPSVSKSNGSKDQTVLRAITCHDDGLGNFIDDDTGDIIGSIDYVTGSFVFNKLDISVSVFRYGREYTYKRVSSFNYSYSYCITSQGPAEVIEVDGKEISGSINFEFYTGGSEESSVDEDIVASKVFEFDTGTVLPMVPKSCSFSYGGSIFLDNGLGKVGVYNPQSNTFVEYGDISYSSKTVTLTKADDSSDNTNKAMVLNSGMTTGNEQTASQIVFRTPAAPVVPSSLTFRITGYESSEPLTATANSEGVIIGDGLIGDIDTETGIVRMSFGQWIPVSTLEEGYETEDWYSPDALSDDGLSIWTPILAYPSTAYASCVVSSYLPLDADLLGLDPVRLPIDGKVPIFRDGEIVLVHNTQELTCPTPLSAGQVINMGRTDLSMIEMYDADGVYIPETDNYIVDLAAGTVTMEDPLDLAAYKEPLVASHRIEDLLLASDVQVTGHISITSPVTNAYTKGDSYVSSVLPAGDIQARVHNKFVQKSWNGAWSNLVSGDGILANYDDVNYPIEVVNQNATQERWAIIFESSTTVKIVGEHLGVIATGVSILNDIAYPAGGNPYFIVRKEGWGTGWATGNVLRFNTAAGNFPIWFCRATLQGPATESSDDYVIAIRGDSS